MMNVCARDIMISEILTVRGHWPVERLAEFLVGNSISGAPVIDEDGRLEGVVSLTDIVRFNTLPVKDSPRDVPPKYYLYPEDFQFEKEEISAFSMKENDGVLVRDIMTRIIFNVDEDANLATIAGTMVRGRIHRVFVTRDEKVIGIISALDVLKVIRDL